MENIFVIENDELSVSVSDAGAELRGVTLRETGGQLLWQGRWTGEEDNG